MSGVLERDGFSVDPSDARSPEVEALAFRLAMDRGGQTSPLSSYDLDRAQEQITGEQDVRLENGRLRCRIAELESEVAALRGSQPESLPA